MISGKYKPGARSSGKKCQQLSLAQKIFERECNCQRQNQENIRIVAHDCEAKEQTSSKGPAPMHRQHGKQDEHGGHRMTKIGIHEQARRISKEQGDCSYVKPRQRRAQFLKLSNQEQSNEREWNNLSKDGKGMKIIIPHP